MDVLIKAIMASIKRNPSGKICITPKTERDLIEAIGPDALQQLTDKLGAQFEVRDPTDIGDEKALLVCMRHKEGEALPDRAAMGSCTYCETSIFHREDVDPKLIKVCNECIARDDGSLSFN